MQFLPGPQNSILHRRSVILPNMHIRVTFGYNTSSQLYILTLFQSKWCENMKKRLIMILNHFQRFCDIIHHITALHIQYFHVPFCPQRVTLHPTYRVPFRPRDYVWIKRAMSTIILYFVQSKWCENT